MVLHDRLKPYHDSQYRPKRCSNCGHVEPWQSDVPPEDHRSIYTPRCSCGWVGLPTTDPEAAHAAHVAEEQRPIAALPAGASS